MDQLFFERYEMKYLLTLRQRELLLERLAPNIEPDRYPQGTIRNLYLDTESFLLARRSAEKPIYKEKLRLRAYTRPEAESDVFLEIKKKYRGVVFKRRVRLPYGQAMEIALQRLPAPQTQVGREIAACQALYGQTLLPRMLLSYDREAYRAREEQDFRLTMDTGIRWRTQELDLAGELDGRPILPADLVLLELKTSGPIPLWMARFLSEQQIFRRSFSKYGLACSSLLQGQKKPEENYVGQVLSKSV